MLLHDENHVDERFGCPSCGERLVDNLVIDEGVVTCLCCGLVYNLETREEVEVEPSPDLDFVREKLYEMGIQPQKGGTHGFV